MNFAARQHVMVEYVFPDVPERALGALPGRVRHAVNTLVGRERLPSDDDVRALVAAASVGAAAQSAEEGGGADARVRVVLPESVAVDLALHRSFEEGGNVAQRQELTTDEVRRLTQRSTRIRLQRLRRVNTDTAGRSQRPDAAASTRRRRRSSPVRETCVICLEKIRFRVDKLYLDPCGHVFHKDCVTEWLAKLPRECPSCRAPVDLTPRRGEVPARVTRSQLRQQRSQLEHVQRMRAADRVVL